VWRGGGKPGEDDERFLFLIKLLPTDDVYRLLGDFLPFTEAAKSKAAGIFKLGPSVSYHFANR
jgi:hypothetical protein